MNLRDYSSQLQQLLSETTSFDVNTGSTIDFIGLRKRYSDLSLQFMTEFNQMIQSFQSQNTFLMTLPYLSHEDVRSLKHSIESMKREIDSLIHEDNDSDNRFRCFLIGHSCPFEIDSQKYPFFVGMPFNDQHADSYQCGIKAMLNRHGVDTEKRLFKADEQYSNFGILCKICKGIQESQNLIRKLDHSVLTHFFFFFSQ